MTAKRTRKSASPRTTVPGLQIDGSTRIVYIHGIGKQSPPGQLKEEWDHALFGRSMGKATCVAYWSDIQYPGCDTKKALPVARRMNTLRLQKELLSVSELTARTATAAEKKYADSMMRTLTARAFAVDPARALKVRGPFSEWLIRLFIKDTSDYFYDEERRAGMQDRLWSTLALIRKPLILVAHSQGSIISHDVLREMEETGLNVKLFVTIGSPLGFSQVQHNIKKPLKAPVVVEAWRNFADRRDLVALDQDLADDFTAPKGLIQDATVANPNRGKGLFSAHFGPGYLGTGKVRAAVREVMDLLQA